MSALPLKADMAERDRHVHFVPTADIILFYSITSSARASLAALRRDADEVICLEDYEVFGTIGLYYRNFSQVVDEEVIETLKRFQCRNLSRRPSLLPRVCCIQQMSSLHG
jgi:hypothetical protein